MTISKRMAAKLASIMDAQPYPYTALETAIAYILKYQAIEFALPVEITDAPEKMEDLAFDLLNDSIDFAARNGISLMMAAELRMCRPLHGMSVR